MATVGNFKTYLWITDSSQDLLLTLLLNWASDYIESICWRTFKSAEFTEYKDGAWQTDIVLKNRPVTTMTSASYNTWTYKTPVRTAIPPTAYNTDLQAWIVMFVSSLPRGFQNLQFVYTAWYTIIPVDIQLACMKIAGAYYNQSKANWITAESVAGDSISYDTVWIPNDVITILSKYSNV